MMNKGLVVFLESWKNHSHISISKLVSVRIGTTCSQWGTVTVGFPCPHDTYWKFMTGRIFDQLEKGKRGYFEPTRLFFWNFPLRNRSILLMSIIVSRECIHLQLLYLFPLVSISKGLGLWVQAGVREKNLLMGISSVSWRCVLFLLRGDWTFNWFHLSIVMKEYNS